MDGGADTHPQTHAGTLEARLAEAGTPGTGTGNSEFDLTLSGSVKDLKNWSLSTEASAA